LDHHPHHLVDFRDLPLQEWDSVDPRGEGALVDLEEEAEDGKQTLLF
jgi:hypothetical protein